MAENYGWLPRIDMDPLTMIGQGLRQRYDRNQIGNAMTGDFAADAETLLRMGRVPEARIVGAMGEAKRRGDIDAAQAYTGATQAKPLSAVQMKALYDAEGKLPGLENTISTLKRVLELNPKTFDGWLASERANIGARGPGELSDFLGIDKNAALATEEWERLMTPEAIQAMSDSFKGATTEKELLTMLNQLSDPGTPKPIRKSVTERMLALINKEADVYRRRIGALKPREDSSVSLGDFQQGDGNLVPGTVVDGYTYKGGDPNDQNSWEAPQ